MNAARERTRCCIVGGGPAGMMLGLLLARGGVPVTVLEKHADFLRDFRGDTVHPSTLAILQQLGLLQYFLARPHRREQQLLVRFADGFHAVGDFSGMRPFDYMAFAPQWDFLDLLADAGRLHSHFDLRMRHEATGLLRMDGCVTGVRVRTPEGEIEIHSDLVIACDGRHSRLREDAGLQVEDFGAPMDALWFRLPRRADDIDNTFGAPAPGRSLVMIHRGDYWQAALIIRKGSGEALLSGPVERFHALVAPLLPFADARMETLASMEEVRLLQVRVDRLQHWHAPGLLLIGDAAHAMSPLGGVGINLAIQDAVAAANLLGPELRDGRGPVAETLLARVQHRRQRPTMLTQWLQRQMQRRLIAPSLDAAPGPPPTMPPLLRALLRLRAVRRIPARVFGYAFARERVRFGPAAP